MKGLTPFDSETLLMMESVSGHTTKVEKRRTGFSVYMSIAVLGHIIHILGFDFAEMLLRAEAKISGRIENPNYMRRHPHKEDNN